VLNSLFHDLPVAADADQDSSALRDWFGELLDHYRGNAAFAQALVSYRGFAPRPANPVFTTPLAATDTCRLSLLAIHPAKPIPLHDHPGAWAAQMLLSGTLLVRHCDLEPQTTGNPALRYLRAISERELGPGGISSITPEARNIHSLAAAGDNAVLLSIQFTPNGKRVQSWFFPLEPPRPGQPLLLCHRVQKKIRRTTLNVIEVQE